MTPEQSAAEILIQGVARVEGMKLVLATALGCFLISALFAITWRWANRTERLNHYKARDAEARQLVEDSIDTIHRLGADVRRFRNMLVETDIYLDGHRPTFDDKDRAPLAGRIKALLGEQPAPLQITVERRAPESEAA